MNTRNHIKGNAIRFIPLLIMSLVALGMFFSPMNPSRAFGPPADVCLDGETITIDLIDLYHYLNDGATYGPCPSEEESSSSSSTATSSSSSSSSSIDTTPRCNGQVATIYVKDGIIVGGPDDGENYRGKLKGTDGNDVIVGTDGEDDIRGKDGNDIICAGAGDDEVEGDDGDDILCGQAGDDEIDGDDDNDRIDGGAGFDEVNGKRGNDTCAGEDVSRCEVGIASIVECQ